ncbi:hypothetical protein D7D52_10145 [Nocardia yunnanensis]|uniref:Uncharacterized protein n=1 Tax=Nocardia yunnanensis TaxID=2382165 RepID=A0A386Z8M3_9NOCA|nr:hypothetical protein [Nocardia yunnanensis]AYF74162.1 hypothetical protein D7D52_10145 [Nocardia yunnanensis]
MNMPDTRTGHMDVFLPQAMNPAVLDAVIRLNVTAAVARTGEWPATIEHGTGRPHSPGVTCWPVTYTTGIPPQQD